MKALAENRRARFDYDITETYEAGIQLAGHEVKSVKRGSMGLNGSYAVLGDGQLWLLNAQIPPYQPNNAPKDYEAAHTRRLLLHKKEIGELAGLLRQKMYTLLPLRVYLKGSLIKVELGLGRSRKQHDKRDVIKKRETERELRRGGK